MYPYYTTGGWIYTNSSTTSITNKVRFSNGAIYYGPKVEKSPEDTFSPADDIEIQKFLGIERQKG